jgi:3-oxoacyl-[acyl-carrier protein] reductase
MKTKDTDERRDRMGKLDKKVAVITGGARGIGKQIALTFSREGADVVIADMREMDEVAQEIKNSGRKVITIKADISKKEEVKNLMDAAVAQFKRLDILVNNAGVGRSAIVTEMAEEDWDFVLNVNLKGVFLCTQAAARYMVGQKYGKIVNIASIAGLVGAALPWNSSNYSASKAGVIRFTKSCSKELGPHGINVNAIAPGLVLTELHFATRSPEDAQRFREEEIKAMPLGRAGTVQDIANIALFLASEDASLVTGQVIVADGGRT